MITNIIEAILNGFGQDFGSASEIMAILVMITCMALYEYLIYRVVSHRCLYNKSFNIAILVLPHFIGIIVASLQSNLVITLGTIGALAIIRFRTAIKDPMDMIYILWSVFIGILCGCKLYESCVLTSLVVTVILLIINLLQGKVFGSSYVLILNCNDDKRDEIDNLLKTSTKKYRLKNMCSTSKGFDYVFQIKCKDTKTVTQALADKDFINKYSLLTFDNEDIM